MRSDTQYSPDSELDEEQASLEDGRPERQIEMLTQLARQKRMIAKITLSFMIVGLILCFTLPVRYQAVSLISTPAQVPSISMFMDDTGKGLGSLAAAAGGLALKNPNAIFIGMLQSRTIADALISQFGLQKVYGTHDMIATRRKLDKRSDITAEKSGLVSISVTDPDPHRAAEMANAYVEQLRVLTRTISAREVARQRAYFEDQLRSQRESLIAAELELQQVEQNKGIVHANAQAMMMFQEMGQLRADIAAKQVQVQTLRSYSTEHNPDVQMEERELSAMQQQASRLSQHGSSSDYGDIGLTDVPANGLEFLRAARELEYQTALYSVLLKQYEATKLDEGNDAYSIEIVDVAVPPDKRSSPKRAILMVVSTIVGLFVGFAWAGYREKWSPWMDDPKFMLSLKVLGAAVIGK
jgi:tyrosine-protein kinase Etk/Wzc